MHHASRSQCDVNSVFLHVLHKGTLAIRYPFIPYHASPKVSLLVLPLLYGGNRLSDLH